jgi:hypothetical protein
LRTRFVILVDVGHVIELHADFSGQGKNYAQFPDAQSFRIDMDQLRDPAIQARLKAAWTDPHSLDPAKKSAEVTRDIAGRLSTIAKRLEGKHDPRDVAEFLMRCLFTMFAEDAGHLSDGRFRPHCGHSMPAGSMSAFGAKRTPPKHLSIPRRADHLPCFAWNSS